MKNGYSLAAVNQKLSKGRSLNVIFKPPNCSCCCNNRPFVLSIADEVNGCHTQSKMKLRENKMRIFIREFLDSYNDLIQWHSAI